MEILSHHPLLLYNTFGVEAYSKEFAEADTYDDIHYLIKSHLHTSINLFVLGGGSNILFTNLFNGLIIRICTKGIEVIRENDDEVHLRVAAGEDWDGLVEYCVSKGWGGLENLSGIPGQVGSSPIQNIGAYGAELKDAFLSLEAINQCTAETESYNAENCQFGYRDSIFKRALKGRVVITHVVFRLQKKPVVNLNYLALKQKLEQLPENEITIKKIRETVLQVRSSKLPDPKVLGNAGSFFKNPVVSGMVLEGLKDRFPGIVYYENSRFAVRSSQDTKKLDGNQEQGTGNCEPGTANCKLAAGWLIEQCGWKGFRDGDAGVHKDQALVLVNYGKASGRDILDLAGKIQCSVRERFGIELEREVNVV